MKHDLIPLYVDLDGTLILSDTTRAHLLLVLKKKPWLLGHTLSWLLKGRAYFKKKLSEELEFPIGQLAYHPEFLDWLKTQKSLGRKLILATGSDQKTAEAIADACGLFDEVFASNGTINLTGTNKLEKLIEHCGSENFAYAGNSAVDLKVWAKAREAIVVNAPKSVLKAAQKMKRVTHVF